MFQEPRQVVVGSDGIVNVIDTVHHRFVRMDSTGHIVGICGERAAEGAELGKFNWPRGLAIDNATGQLWVADTKQNRLQIVQPNCAGRRVPGRLLRRCRYRAVQLALRRRDQAVRPHRVRRRHREQPPQVDRRRDPPDDRALRHEGDRVRPVQAPRRHHDQPRQREHLRRRQRERPRQGDLDDERHLVHDGAQHHRLRQP